MKPQADARRLIDELRATLGQTQALPRTEHYIRPVRCRFCSLVTLDGTTWASRPGPVENEVSDGTCKPCGDEWERKRRRKQWLADEQARRERREGKTYGPDPEGRDSFRGFREPCATGPGSPNRT